MSTISFSKEPPYNHFELYQKPHITYKGSEDIFEKLIPETLPLKPLPKQTGHTFSPLAASDKYSSQKMLLKKLRTARLIEQFVRALPPLLAHADVFDLKNKQFLIPSPFDKEALEKRKTALVALAQTAEDKALIKKATANLQHITFAMLLSHLSLCIEQFNRLIRSDPYTALIDNGKSSEWITHLALNDGMTPPQRIQRTAEPFRENSMQTLVIFDDCAYTGVQITNLLRLLADARCSACIIVVIPFMSLTAQKRILACAKEKGIFLHVITSPLAIRELDTIFSAEELLHFCRLFIEEDSSLKPENLKNCLTFTDWKRPDAVSVSHNFLDGKIAPFTRDTSLKEPLVPLIMRPYGFSRNQFLAKKAV